MISISGVLFAWFLPAVNGEISARLPMTGRGGDDEFERGAPSTMNSRCGV